MTGATYGVGFAHPSDASAINPSFYWSRRVQSLFFYVVYFFLLFVFSFSFFSKECRLVYEILLRSIQIITRFGNIHSVIFRNSKKKCNIFFCHTKFQLKVFAHLPKNTTFWMSLCLIIKQQTILNRFRWFYGQKVHRYWHRTYM